MAKVTGRVHSPLRNSAWASVGLAAAKTSAGAPRSICACSVLEPPKLYFGPLLSAGKTLVRDVAA